MNKGLLALMSRVYAGSRTAVVSGWDGHAKVQSNGRHQQQEEMKGSWAMKFDVATCVGCGREV